MARSSGRSSSVSDVFPFFLFSYSIVTFSNHSPVRAPHLIVQDLLQLAKCTLLLHQLRQDLQLRLLRLLHLLLLLPLNKAAVCLAVKTIMNYMSTIAIITIYDVGLGRTMAEGFSFGIGSAVARNVVNSVMGGGSSSSAPAPSAPAPMAPPAAHFEAPKMNGGACDFDHKELMRCLQENPSSSSLCEFQFNALQACQQRGI